MAYKPNNHSGAAAYNSWMQLKQDVIDGVKSNENPEDNLLTLDPENRKYAQLVYTVNPADINVENLNLDFEPQDPEYYVQNAYSRIIKEDANNNTYIMFAEPGSLESDAKWRIQQITPDGDRKYPNSTTTFTFVATLFETYTYSY